MVTQEQPERPLQQAHTRRHILIRRWVIGIIALVFFAGGAIIWALNNLGVIQGAWSRVLPIIFVVLSVAIPFFQWLFSFSSDHSDSHTHPAPHIHIHVPTTQPLQSNSTDTIVHQGTVERPLLINHNEEAPIYGNKGPVPAHVGTVFLVNQALPDTRELFGRTRERMTLVSRTRNGASTSILGSRRIGKSWLIKYLRLVATTELSSRFHIGYLDATSPSCATVNGFTNRAIEELSTTALLTDPSNQSLATLEMHVRNLRSRNWTPVLCIDEFEGFSNRQEFNLDFFRGLRAIAQAGLVVVVASRHSVDEVIGDCGGTSPFFNIFAQIDLKPFNLKEAREFADNKSAQARFTDQERACLLKYGEMPEQQWSPLRLQLVGEMLLEDKVAALEDPDSYRPAEQGYWKAFEERLEDAWRRFIR